MEVGTEISQKIRSAIKAKLIELGAYVDDELPDYIMVMVANKKTQKQMTDDLTLFLGTNTEKFTLWLHGLLKKLQSINTDQPPGKPKPKEKKSDRKKHKTNVSEKATKSEEEIKNPPADSSKQVPAKRDKPEEKVLKEGSKKEAADGSAPQTQPELTTEINISENTDEFADECQEIQKKEKGKSSSTGKPPPAKVKKVEQSVDDGKAPAAKVAKVVSKTRSSSSSDKTKAVSKEARKKPSSIVASVKRRYEPEEEDEENEEYDPLNPAVGSLASVVQGPSRKSSVPKSLQANKSLLMKAVSDAEKSVSTSKRREPSGQHDGRVGMCSDQKQVDISSRLKTAAGLQLISRSKRKQVEGGMRSMLGTESEPLVKQRRTSNELKNLKFSVKNEQGQKISPKSKDATSGQARVIASALKKIGKKVPEPTDDQQDEEEEVYGPPLPDTRRVQHIVPVQRPHDTTSARLSGSDSASPTEEVLEEAVDDPEIAELLEGVDDTELDLDEDLYIEETQQVVQSDTRKIATKDPEAMKDPRFIVTLDGVDPNTYSITSEDRRHLVQTVKPTPQYQPTPVAPTEPQPPTTKPPDTDPIYSKIQPPKIKPFNINLKDTDDEEEMEEETTPQDKMMTSFERCKFWPACANGNSCTFVHPSVPCKLFPYCKFGEKCLYIHPNCRFDAKCTRRDCPFTHATRKSGAIAQTVIHKIVQVPVESFKPHYPIAAARPLTQQCRFYPNCKNMNCPFVHPKPCRYGIGCMNKSTCSFNHPPLPEKSKMKWSPGEKKDSSTGTEVSPMKAAAAALAAATAAATAPS